MVAPGVLERIEARPPDTSKRMSKRGAAQLLCESPGEIDREGMLKRFYEWATYEASDGIMLTWAILGLLYASEDVENFVSEYTPRDICERFFKGFHEFVDEMLRSGRPPSRLVLGAYARLKLCIPEEGFDDRDRVKVSL